MDIISDIREVDTVASNLPDHNLLASKLPVIIEEGRWQVRSMDLRPGKAEALWAIVSKFKTLFSDMSGGTFDMWATLITDPDSIWFEICEGERLGALVVFQHMSQLLDVEVHIVALDRKPAEKVEAARLLFKHVFAEYPMIHRVTMQPLTIFYAAIRLAEKLGFVHEGTKREAALIRGKWANQAIMGLLRSNV